MKCSSDNKIYRFIAKKQPLKLGFSISGFLLAFHFPSRQTTDSVLKLIPKACKLMNNLDIKESVILQVLFQV